MSLNNILRIIFMKYRLERHNQAITELSAEIDNTLKEMECNRLQLTSILTEIALLNTDIREIHRRIINKISEEIPSKKSKISETKFKGMFTRLFDNLTCFTSTYHSLFVGPKPFSCAAAAATNGDINERTFQGNVYSHWFAVGMYDLRRELERLGDLDNKSQLQLPLLGEKMTLEVSRLNRLMEFRKIIMQDSYELTMASGLAVALDHFLFACQPGQYPKGFCCHQMPIPYERPYITVFPYPKEWLDPTEFVALTRIKVNFDHESKIKSLAYAIEQQGEKIDKIRLVVAMAKEGFSLYIYVPITGLVLYIDICNEYESSLEVLFCLLYAGVHYLLNHPIQSTMVPQPLKDLEVTGMYGPHVLVSKGFVYKLFDTVPISTMKPNLDIVKLVLPEAEVENLSEDGRYCLLKYRDREENGSPNQKAFRQILSQLHKIHEIGYVHSDIREENIVFGKEQAWIIDFDLAEKEDERYPYGYNHRNIKERHPEARAWSAKKKIHDVHALDVIMRTHKFSGILEQYELGASLLEIAKSVTEAMEVEN